jgi:hypothetical protein
VFQYEHADWCWECFAGAFKTWKGLFFNKLNGMDWKWLHVPSTECIVSQLVNEADSIGKPLDTMFLKEIPGIANFTGNGKITK